MGYGGRYWVGDSDVGDIVMLVTLWWWLILDVGGRIIMLATFFVMLVIFSMYYGHHHPESVINISNLSPTDLVSNNRHQHRCNLLSLLRWKLRQEGHEFPKSMKFFLVNFLTCSTWTWTLRLGILPHVCAWPSLKSVAIQLRRKSTFLLISSGRYRSGKIRVNFWY